MNFCKEYLDLQDFNNNKYNHENYDAKNDEDDVDNSDDDDTDDNVLTNFGAFLVSIAAAESIFIGCYLLQLAFFASITLPHTL